MSKVEVLSINPLTSSEAARQYQRVKLSLTDADLLLPGVAEVAKRMRFAEEGESKKNGKEISLYNFAGAVVAVAEREGDEGTMWDSTLRSMKLLGKSHFQNVVLKPWWSDLVHNAAVMGFDVEQLVALRCGMLRSL